MCMGKRRWWSIFGEGNLRQMALRIYNMPTMSTISRLCLHVANHIYGLFPAFWCARVTPPPPYVPSPPYASPYPGATSCRK